MWNDLVRRQVHSDYLSMLQVDDVGWISAHFPSGTSPTDKEKWDNVISVLRSTVSTWQSTEPLVRRWYMGMDANLTLPGNIHDMTGDLVSSKVTKLPDRIHSLVALLSSLKLALINTSEEACNHEHSKGPITWADTQGNESQIDYVGLPLWSQAKFSLIKGEGISEHLKSDHHFVLTEITDDRDPIIQVTEKPFSLTGWEPSDLSQEKAFN